MNPKPPLLRVCHAEALPGAQHLVIEGVCIPFVGLDALIASKETYREQDAVDRARLVALRESRASTPRTKDESKHDH